MLEGGGVSAATAGGADPARDRVDGDGQQQHGASDHEPHRGVHYEEVEDIISASDFIEKADGAQLLFI